MMQAVRVWWFDDYSEYTNIEPCEGADAPRPRIFLPARDVAAHRGSSTFSAARPALAPRPPRLPVALLARLHLAPLHTPAATMADSDG